MKAHGRPHSKPHVSLPPLPPRSLSVEIKKALTQSDNSPFDFPHPRNYRPHPQPDSSHTAVKFGHISSSCDDIVGMTVELGGLSRGVKNPWRRSIVLVINAIRVEAWHFLRLSSTYITRRR